MGEARDELLDRVIAHITPAGFADLSLRDLAAAIGTSHRMLNYHFGGRNGLVAAIVERVEATQRAMLASLAADGTNPAEVARAHWAELTRPEVVASARLFYEVVAHVLCAPADNARFLAGLTTPWIDTATAAASTLGIPMSAADARLAVAVIRGLLIDVLASGDAGPATEAFERFLALSHPTR